MSEQTYTLREARRIIRREQCDTEGHDLTDIIVSSLAGPLAHHIHCDRCDATFSEDES